MKEEMSMESRIQQAMKSRVQHFRDQADDLTFEKVRRLLEKDLVLDEYALDAHKKYVKQLLEKYLSEAEEDENVSKDSEKVKLEEVKEEQAEEEKVKEIRNEDEGKIEDSPVMGLLSDNKSTKSEISEKSKTQKDKIPTEDMIIKAVRKRATYFRSKSEELTVAGVRRLLEEDLKLEKLSLDPFKKLISKQLDEVLNSEDDTPDNESKEKPKKKSAAKGKVEKSEVAKKRKKPNQENEKPMKKKAKLVEEKSVKKKKNDDDSDDENSESSAEKSMKKEVVAPVYGKKVERLKSVIKACGMTVAPSVYRKAKQAPEDKREAYLIKELQEVLSKEGLSSNPSEKEIKEVKRRKERAKELEGIDTSNIVSGSRRRSSFNFVPPPKPKEIIESDSSEDTDNDDEDDSGESDNEVEENGDDQDQDEEDNDDDKDQDEDEQDNGDDKDKDEDKDEEDNGDKDQNEQDNGDATKNEEIHEGTKDSDQVLD